METPQEKGCAMDEKHFEIGDPVYFEYACDGRMQRIYGHVVGVFGRYVGVRASEPHPWPLRVELVHHAIGDLAEDDHHVIV
jgi:hypothetical protein